MSSSDVTPISTAEWAAELIKLSDAGHCNVEVVDDDESREFAEDVRALNRDWQPGEIPRVPIGYRDGVAWRRGRATPRPSRGRVPRTRRGTSRARARSPGSSSDGDEPDDVAGGAP